MLATLQQSLQRPTAVRPSRKPQSVRATATAQTVEKAESPAAAEPRANSKAAEIYLGHGKDQIAEKSAGKKGRVIIDDPSKYPERTDLTGGWAGGEKGLKEFVAAYQRELELNGGAAPAKPAKPAKSHEPRPIAKGDDTIYLGRGRVIQDDSSKYPSRNELTGGFAGGELGLSVFKEKGDVPIAPAGQGNRQNSPLITAFVLGLAATGGGLLLSTVEEVGSSVVAGDAAPALAASSSLGLDEQTKAILTGGILLVGVIGTVAGAQLLLDSVATKLRAGASKLAVLGAFWVVVFLAAKLVIES